MNRQDAVKTLYHYAAKSAHPDAGGTHDAMIAVQEALRALSGETGETGFGTTTTMEPMPDDLLEWLEKIRRESEDRMKDQVRCAEQAAERIKRMQEESEQTINPFGAPFDDGLDRVDGQSVSDWHRHQTRPCRNCGVLFRQVRQDARYCSSACRGSAWRRRHPAKRKYFRPLHPVCSICGSAFEARRKTARYCSSACAQVAYRRRKADAKP